MIQSCLNIFALDSLTTGKTLIGLFLPHNLVHSMYPNFSDQIQFRLKTVNEIKDYFIAEVRKIGAISKGISKYIAAIDYFDKASLISLKPVVEYLLFLLLTLFVHLQEQQAQVLDLRFQ